MDFKPSRFLWGLASVRTLLAATLAIASATFTAAAAALIVSTTAPARVQLHHGPIEFGRRRIGDVPRNLLWLRARLRRSGPQPVPSRQRRHLRRRGRV
jgi:hypothetical protein